MATVDIIDINGEKFYLMNVSAAVGPNHGEPDDVMLVKALLRVVLMSWGQPAEKCPEPVSGAFDKQTKENIPFYQKKYNEFSKSGNSPNRLTVDGRVSRARGKYSWDKQRPWTIATLNEVASFYVRMYGFKSAAAFIAAAYPHLAKILKIDINTL